MIADSSDETQTRTGIVFPPASGSATLSVHPTPGSHRASPLLPFPLHANMSQLLRKKTLADVQKAVGDKPLKRVMGPVNLTLMGIGAVIGAGIFVATGEAARNVAGPALMVSYMLAGLICVFAALCYAEFASMAPVSDSAYTYAYTTLGELFAWIVGWDLVLEYAVGAATVANGWSGYTQSVFHKFGFDVPAMLSKAPWVYEGGELKESGAYIDLPAVLVVTLLTMLLVRGIKESAAFNTVMVAIKVSVVLFVIAVGAFFIDPANYSNFAPFGWGGVSLFGSQELTIGQVTAAGKPLGMVAGAAIIFFAYIGFDAVSTQAEEAKNPQRDVPIGIIASLLVCTVLYIAVVAVLTGMVRYDQINEKAGVSAAFSDPKVGLPWADVLIAVAGVAGITSVLLVMMLSGPRVLMAMSRDGLLPPFFASIHNSYRTPWTSTICVGVFVGLAAGLLPLGALLEMTNIGTLFAFFMVCVAILVLRKTSPHLPRPFRCPLVPAVPVLGAAGSLLLMMSLPPANWVRLVVWMGLGLILYFSYGLHHSRLNRPAETAY